MNMNIGYRLKRKQVQIRQRKEKKRTKRALNLMTPEQLKMYKLILDIVTKDNTSINFVPDSTEILISVPNMLITLNGYKVFVQNSHGFHTSEFPTESYKLITDVVHTEANRLRRKLKHSVKQRINTFLSSITEPEMEYIDLEFIPAN